jgi:hypothetical protein
LNAATMTSTGTAPLEDQVGGRADATVGLEVAAGVLLGERHYQQRPEHHDGQDQGAGAAPVVDDVLAQAGRSREREPGHHGEGDDARRIDELPGAPGTVRRSLGQPLDGDPERHQPGRGGGPGDEVPPADPAMTVNRTQGIRLSNILLDSCGCPSARARD